MPTARFSCGTRIGFGTLALVFLARLNASTIGAEVHLPFGGTKATGNGHREGGTQVLDVFSEWKAVYVDYSGKLQRAQIDPVSEAG